jgi:hypothetical protein
VDENGDEDVPFFDGDRGVVFVSIGVADIFTPYEWKFNLYYPKN